MRLYRTALDRDPRNLGAQVNLARLLAQEKGNNGALEQAIQMLERLEQATVDRPREAARYAGLYSLAVARYDLGKNKLESEAKDNKLESEAREGWTLLEEALDVTADLKREVAAGGPRFGHSSMQEYHGDLLPGVEALWVGLSLVCSEKPTTAGTRKQETLEDSPEMAEAGRLLRTFLRESKSESALPLRALYNRACTLSIAAKMARNGGLPVGGASVWRTVVRKVASAAPTLFDPASAEVELELQEKALVEAAYAYLATAVCKDPSLATGLDADLQGSFIRRDRSLEFLRTVGKEDKEQGLEDRFRSIEEPYLTMAVEPPADELALAKLDAISSERAARLSELGIDSWADLFLRVATPQDRIRLARALDVGKGRLRQWAELLDLLRIDELSISDLNLLEKAQVHSREQLKRADPEQLAALLVSGADPEGTPPDQSDVDLWWRVAHTEDSLVVGDAVG